PGGNAGAVPSWVLGGRGMPDESWVAPTWPAAWDGWPDRAVVGWPGGWRVACDRAEDCMPESGGAFPNPPCECPADRGPVPRSPRPAIRDRTRARYPKATPHTRIHGRRPCRGGIGKRQAPGHRSARIACMVSSCACLPEVETIGIEKPILRSKQSPHLQRET